LNLLTAQRFPAGYTAGLGHWRYASSIAQPVSPDELDRFKEQFECWDRDELDLMQDNYAEDGVFDVSAVFTDVAPMQGHRNMRRYWNELRDTWEEVRTDPHEVFDVGDGRYVVDLRLWGKGKRSGIEVEQRFAFLYTFRPGDGKIARAQLFPDVAAALSVAESSAPQTA
jgi:ketosteroid isomerase-like protein